MNDLHDSGNKGQTEKETKVEEGAGCKARWVRTCMRAGVGNNNFNLLGSDFENTSMSARFLKYKNTFRYKKHSNLF